jgi:protein-S-isoprenylcysteine O-methyltransferase Ste14
MTWVLAQSVLMAAVLATWLLPPRAPERPAAFVLSAAGLVLAGWAYRALGAAFTPFPEPRGPRVESGPYRWLRHPMYVGGVAVLAGGSLAFDTLLGLGLTAALAVLWWRKARLEERLLDARGRTPGR